MNTQYKDNIIPPPWFISTWQMLKLFPSEWNSITWFIWSFCLVWHKWVQSLMSIQMKKYFWERTVMESWDVASTLHLCMHECVCRVTYDYKRLLKIDLHLSICINMCFVSYSATGRIDRGSASVAALCLGADDDSLSPLHPWPIHAIRKVTITVTLFRPCLYTSPV